MLRSYTQLLTIREITTRRNARKDPRHLSALLSVLALLLSHSPASQAGSYARLVRQVTPSVVTVLVDERPEDAGQRAAERAASATNSEAMRATLRRLLLGPDNSSDLSDGDAVLGSGFVIRADGLIVTNRHVVAGARVVRVRFAGGREVVAQILGTDAATDIALLKVRAGPLPALRLGSSAEVSVGDPVLAIGNPFGLGQSVTAGIVSARGRTLAEDPYIDFLQTDAAINFGNSGGPLLSADGAVVGVTSAILSPNGGSIGLGFAIPAETVAGVVREIEAQGHVDRAYLGISVQPMTPAVARTLGLNVPTGALITHLEPQGPSAKTLSVGDVLLKIDSTAVTFEGLGRIVARLKPGVTVEATVRRDGMRLIIPLTIGRLPDPPDRPSQPGDSDTWVPNLGLGVAKATSAIRRALKADDDAGGLIVTQLRPAGPGALAGLEIGDLLTEAGTKQLQDVGDLARVGTPSAQVPLLLRIVRSGSTRFIAVTGSAER